MAPESARLLDPPPPITPRPPARRWACDGRLLDASLILGGSAVTLAIYGYQFGEGNHTIYLLDALRRAEPQLLANDWFATQTFQYHAIFGGLAQLAFRWGIAGPAFFCGYLLLVVAFHAMWLGAARHMTGTRAAYPVSLALYYASAAGTGLGFYQFFQDSSLLPSNIANVAMLCGLCGWIREKFGWSGLCFGIAGLFHLNHAIAGVTLWVILCLLEVGGRRGLLVSAPTLGAGNGVRRTRQIVAGSVLVIVPSMANILLAAGAKFQRSGSMPLREFVELYVRLRHPHHYDPSSWPAWLWAAFLWPVPIALLVLARRRDLRRVAHVVVVLLAVQVAALLGAGVWYVSETLVQMSLYRFSIFPQLICCILVASVVTRVERCRIIAVAGASAACAAMIAIGVARGPFFGAFGMPRDDAEYHELCDWASRRTPAGAIFLVPPGETSFRLRAKRAIVVNFKAVPQLSGELPAWRDRLRDVLHVQDLKSFPRGYATTMRAMNARYSVLSPAQLIAVARQYGARYIVAPRRLEQGDDANLIFATANERYFLYDLAGEEEDGE